jgi:hypothetical protein
VTWLGVLSLYFLSSAIYVSGSSGSIPGQVVVPHMHSLSHEWHAVTWFVRVACSDMARYAEFTLSQRKSEFVCTGSYSSPRKSVCTGSYLSPRKK